MTGVETCWQVTGPSMKSGLSLKFVENPQTIAQTVSAILGIDYQDTLARASLKPSDTAVYSVLVDNVPQEEIDKLAVVIEQMNALVCENQRRECAQPERVGLLTLI